jgi:flagellar protein FliS
MRTQDAANTYKQESVENAPPIKILRMLCAGALRYMDRAAACDPSDPSSEFVDMLYKAEAIITELRLTLNPEEAPEFVANMQDLYLFVDAELQKALMERSVEPIANARVVFAKLADAWNQVEVGDQLGAARP